MTSHQKSLITHACAHRDCPPELREVLAGLLMTGDLPKDVVTWKAEKLSESVWDLLHYHLAVAGMSRPAQRESYMDSVYRTLEYIRTVLDGFGFSMPPPYIGGVDPAHEPNP